MAFAEVRILDQSVRHLDRAFTYACDETLPPGTLVRVPFNGRLRNGIVVAEGEPFQGAKRIKQIRGPGLPSWMVPFADDLAARTLTDPGATLSALVPERVTSEEAKVPETPLSPAALEPGPPPEWLMRALAPPGRALFVPGIATDAADALARLVHEDLAAGGNVLVVLPGSDRGSIFATALSEIGGDTLAWLGSDVSPRLRYRAWLCVRSGVARLAVGGRAAIFAPFLPSLIVVVDEGNVAHKEGRAPRFHVREVAQMLASRHGARLLLVGLPPSIEARIDADPKRGVLAHVGSPSGIRCDVRVVDPAGLVPAPVTMRLVESATGRILALVHRADQLAQAAERLGRHLQRDVITIDASAEATEMDRARAADGPPVVVTTTALAVDRPILGISTVTIHGADAALASPSFRAAEEVVGSWWRLLHATRPERVVVESRDREHHAIAALAKLDHDLFARREAETRHALGYPPYRTLVRLQVDAEHLDRIVGDLEGHVILGPMTDPHDLALPVVAVRGDRTLVDALRPLVTAWRADGVRVKVDVGPWDLVEERWRS